jgi:hypothetical protein
MGAGSVVGEPMLIQPSVTDPDGGRGVPSGPRDTVAIVRTLAR